MRGVLIDDDHPLGGLGDDIGVVQLPARRPQGMPRRRLIVHRRGRDIAPGRGVDIGQRRLRGPRDGRRLVGGGGLGEARSDCTARPEGGGHRCRAHRAVPGLGQRVLERADDQAAHRRRIAEPDLGLRRVHVHVHLVGLGFEEQGHDRVTVASQQVLIGGAHAAEQELVADRAGVDEQILGAGMGAVERG